MANKDWQVKIHTIPEELQAVLLQVDRLFSSLTDRCIVRVRQSAIKVFAFPEIQLMMIIKHFQIHVLLLYFGIQTVRRLQDSSMSLMITALLAEALLLREIG